LHFFFSHANGQERVVALFGIRTLVNEAYNYSILAH